LIIIDFDTFPFRRSGTLNGTTLFEACSMRCSKTTGDDRDHGRRQKGFFCMALSLFFAE